MRLFYEVQSAAFEEPRACATLKEAEAEARNCQPYAASIDALETTLKGRALYVALANGEGYVSKRTRVRKFKGESDADEGAVILGLAPAEGGDV